MFSYEHNGTLASDGDVNEQMQNYYLRQAGRSSSSAASASSFMKPPLPSPSFDQSCTDEHTAQYSRSHRTWTPHVAVAFGGPLTTDEDRIFPPRMEKEAYTNYIHTPQQLGERPLPALAYHTSCEVADFLYCVGGVVTLHQEYRSGTADLARYEVKGMSMPPPINSILLNHPCVIPNEHIYMISSLTHHVTVPKSTGDVPPPLLCLSSCKITKRHIFFCGGFQLINDVTYDEESGKFCIKKLVEMNTHAYVLDVMTMNFVRFEVIAKPNKLEQCPSFIPRFGHGSLAVNLSKISSEGRTPCAVVFIVGGYTPTDVPSRYEAVNDLWKVELSVLYEGIGGYVEFGDVVLATLIPTPPGDPAAAPRAFFAIGLFDSLQVHGEPEKQAKQNSYKSGLDSASDTQGNLRLLVHGGTNGTKILGDTWLFDFGRELWHEMDTYFHDKKGRHRCNLKKTGHHGYVMDKFFVTLLGAVPSDFPNYLNNFDGEAEAKDISQLLSTKRDRYEAPDDSTNPNFYRLFSLYLPTGTWTICKVYHSLVVPGNIRKNTDLVSFGNLGGTVTLGNLRSYIIGGCVVPNLALRSMDMTQVLILHGAVSLLEIPMRMTMIDPTRID